MLSYRGNPSLGQAKALQNARHGNAARVTKRSISLLDARNCMSHARYFFVTGRKVTLGPSFGVARTGEHEVERDVSCARTLPPAVR